MGPPLQPDPPPPQNNTGECGQAVAECGASACVLCVCCPLAMAWYCIRLPFRLTRKCLRLRDRRRGHHHHTFSSSPSSSEIELVGGDLLWRPPHRRE
ncbi:hypothetical protein FCM35_KLT08266 [Carex littledalei]|uniref:Uncharacterized protein n=1 Tax=Carex littledalei TaxID=544730 RepID=A0A833V6I3_9POAL|nr:hypothetical protein FCM35_KLT08266 [Carex littledalei]